MTLEIHLGCVYHEEGGSWWRVRGIVFGDILCRRVGDGAELRVPLAEFKGRWCAPTKEELIKVNQLEEEFEAARKPLPNNLDTVPAPKGEEPTGKRRRDEPEAGLAGHGLEKEVGILMQPTASDGLDQLVLDSATRRALEDGLRMVTRRREMEEVWRLSQAYPNGTKCALSFYGAPGTGKTRAARGVALRLGKPLYVVDYARLTSKWVGDTEKHIKLAFESSRRSGSVLFFDEADSLLSQRVDAVDTTSQFANQSRNVLMQELDRHDGVVIFATNLFTAYDRAFLRRVSHHVKFELPDAAGRRRLFERHLPNPERVKLSEAEWQQLASLSRGLSGGDIANACVNAMVAASASPDPAKWHLDFDTLRAEVRQVLSAKAAHDKKNPTFDLAQN